MDKRLKDQPGCKIRTRIRLSRQIDVVELDWAECPSEEREQMRRELAPALDRLETVIRESNVDAITQAEQLARIEALRQKIAG
jgi:hypothetical protein